MTRIDLLAPLTPAGARSTTVRLRAPWAPWMITPTKSPVADGPATKSWSPIALCENAM